MMKYEYIRNVTDQLLRREIWDIFCECEQEFVPPLSSRNSTYQTSLNAEEDLNTPDLYYQTMIQQQFIICRNQNQQLLGFMTFIHDYSCLELSSIGSTNYITTICVLKPFRNQGILKNMYKYVHHSIPDEVKLENIATRTWSTNTNHIHVLDQCGYHKVKVLNNHRGPGIDTIYYSKKVKNLINC